MKKNDEFEIDITDMGSEGEGIGRYEGMAFFIKGAVIGDRVLAGVTKLKKTFGYARLIKIIEPSLYRVDADCPVAKRCGGCQLRSLSYEKQLEFKENKVKNDLIRLGGIEAGRFVLNGECENKNHTVLWNPIIGMEKPVHYRNKGQFPVGTDRQGKLVTGFYAGRTHEIIDCDSCLIQHEITDVLMAAVRKYMLDEQISAYDELTGKGLVRHVLTRVGFTTGEVMVCMVINGRRLPKAEILVEYLQKAVGDKLTSVTFSVNTEKTNVILGNSVETVFGTPYISDYIGDVKYRISPLSFYQVNPEQTKKLYSTALEYADVKGRTVWDLYCGIGTISLFMAKEAKQVYGVEIVPAAIEDAKENAKLNHIENAEFFVGAAEEALPAKYAENPDMTADVIVVDPPRKGCDEKLLQCMASLAPERIVYVSCDPATLSRDVKFLEANGYELKKVQTVDMFPGSVHVETVVLLSKGDIDKESLERKSVAKNSDTGMISSYGKENKTPETTNVKIDFSLENLNLSELRGKATYEQIKDYVREQTGFRVSTLCISQVKRKCGLEVGESYNKPKSEDAKQPQCTPEKEAAIMQALRHYGMI